jgi:hypothetical protein
MYKVVTLRLHCTSQLFHQLPSSPNRTKSLSTMTAFLQKSKVVLLEHMKSIPNAPATEDEDYIVWGKRFVEIVVSR